MSMKIANDFHAAFSVVDLHNIVLKLWQIDVLLAEITISIEILHNYDRLKQFIENVKSLVSWVAFDATVLS